MQPVDEETRAWLAERYWAEDDALTQARTTFQETGPLIEVPRDTAAALAMLVRASGATRVLEVGTLFGYSAVWMARALPAGGHLDTLELEDVHADAAEALFAAAGVADRVTVHRGAALDSLAALDGPWDLAFLDADKEGYVDYANAIIPKLRRGGLLLADNVAGAGRVIDATNDSDVVVGLRAYHAFLAADDRLDTNVLPIGDGLAVSVVR